MSRGLEVSRYVSLITEYTVPNSTIDEVVAIAATSERERGMTVERKDVADGERERHRAIGAV